MAGTRRNRKQVPNFVLCFSITKEGAGIVSKNAVMMGGLLLFS